MKRSATFLFLGVFALTQLASAEDQLTDKQRAQANKAIAKWQARHPNQTPQLNARTRAALGYKGPTASAQVNQPRVFTPANNNNATVNVNRGRWRDRANWNANGDARVYNNVPQQNTDSSTSVNDWQNRSRTGEWNGGTRWSNNHNWDRRHRNRAWWRSHYTRFALFGGGYYYWNNGWWYPAYGYDPYFSDYAYDAPIYAYNDQDPGQVIAEVQAALNRRGYNAGPVDGSYGPQTRRALLGFQRDNGLPVTGQIDEATLDTLGFR